MHLNPCRPDELDDCPLLLAPLIDGADGVAGRVLRHGHGIALTRNILWHGCGVALIQYFLLQGGGIGPTRSARHDRALRHSVTLIGGGARTRLGMRTLADAAALAAARVGRRALAAVALPGVTVYTARAGVLRARIKITPNGRTISATAPMSGAVLAALVTDVTVAASAAHAARQRDSNVARNLRDPGLHRVGEHARVRGTAERGDRCHRGGSEGRTSCDRREGVPPWGSGRLLV